MASKSEIADQAALDYFRSRLPPEFIRGLPGAIQQGYDNAKRGRLSHLKRRRAASDRYWSVMEAVAAFAETVPGMRVLDLHIPNGGGPYVALECDGTLLTIHKTEAEDAPPRSCTSRRNTSQMNERCMGTLFPLEDFDPPLGEPDGTNYLDGVDPVLLKAFNLYILVTHHPDGVTSRV